MDRDEINRLVTTALSASVEAGREILKIYSTDFEIERKQDDSPLTIADMNSHRIIVKYLEETRLYHDNNIPILSEEGKDIPYQERQGWEYFWLVDPLDGTKEFIKRNGEFTVNIALIHRGRPKIGVIYIPVRDTLYFSACGIGAFKISRASTEISILSNIINNTIDINIPSLSILKNSLYTEPEEPVRIIGSRSHSTPLVEDFIEKIKTSFGKIEFISAGSSLKFCLIAEGRAVIYPRFAPTMEWDTAAGQAIVEEAGGRVIDMETMTALKYNKKSLKNPFFLATANLHEDLINRLFEILPCRKE
ncbi:MAG: 3'(2'),5'-bisphosphate nucleotidase CysQ [Nitrospirae bacterium]|nr:3'(2'),5'-bisphosphate nucleotidase CysQ [Nitrospirota bacterium]